jgi:internalin A
MKTLPLALLAAAGLLACDEPKDNKAVDAAPSAAAVLTPPASAAPTASASAPAPAPSYAKKSAADCKPHPATIDFGADGSALEAQVRLKLSKPKGDITPADLAKVKTINLTTSNVPLHQIDPCIFPMFTSMTEIFFGTGDYDDLTPIQGLTNLDALRISLSRVKDLHPLTGMKKMDRLDLSHTLIGDEDLRIVAQLTNVTELMLDEDNVSDLTPVGSLKKLEKLSIKNTLVKDLTPIANLHSLKILYIAGSGVSDISPVQPLMNGGMKLIQTEH